MIAVIGEALVDLVIAPDGSVVAHLGGGPYNAARAASRLGADVGFYGALSSDRFGRSLADQLTADGVDITHAPQVDRPTTIAAAEIDVDGSASYHFYTVDTSAELFEATAVDLSAVDVVFTGGLALVLQPMADEVDRLVSSSSGGVAVMIDVNCRPRVVADRAAYQRRVERILSRAHIIKVSTDDLRYLQPAVEFSVAAQALVDRGIGVVLLTDGGSDVTIFTKSGERSVAVPHVDVVDTVGAGDAFCGGFLASAQARGVKLDSEAVSLDELAVLVGDAVAVSAIACQRAGADPPRRSEVPGWVRRPFDLGIDTFEVRDHAPHAWFLFEGWGALFLDANCNHSAYGYNWMIELNAHERARFAAEGRAFLDHLADAIHMSVPVAVGSTSPYKYRDVSNEHAAATQDAIRRWRSRAASP